MTAPITGPAKIHCASPPRSPTPFGRQATGWEVAYAALFFIGEESVYVTGQTLAVDSGLTGIS